MYGTVALVETPFEWTASCESMVDEIRAALGRDAVGVEHVGSTAVPGLLAKPICDVAVATAADADRERIVATLERLGFEFRGDAGDQGGLIFVLETRPRHRVAHVHVVDHDDPQWVRYLAFRDLLKANVRVREEYADLKRTLAEQFAGDRKAYTAGKVAFVDAALAAHFASSS
jgi:GrpB-like predicted nucleotidyltransferase (UPF0157 family)